MKYKFLLGALAFGCAFSAYADGYTDGIDYYNAGQYGNSRTILNRTINDQSTDKAKAYYYLGQIELLYKNAAKAKEYFDLGLAANPNSALNNVGLGAYYLSQKNAKEAETYFKKAQSLAKKDAKIPVEIARAYYNSNPDDAKTMETVRKYIDKARKDSKNTEPAIYILEGDILFNMGGHLGDAASQYEMAISYDNDNPEGYVKYSKAYMGVNPEFGVQKMEELLQRQPNSALAQRELAERYYETNQWHKAVRQYSDYMNNPNHFPEDKARYDFLLYVYQDYDKAVSVADEILAEFPDNFQAKRIKMLSQTAQKNYQGAYETAQNFFATPNPSSPFTLTDYNTYGQILSEIQKPNEAVAAYEKALELDPVNTATLSNLAFAYSDIDLNQKAAETMQKAIDCSEDPSLSLYYRASGLWLFAAGDDTLDDATKSANAQKGLDCVQVVLDRAQVTPDYIRRKAQLTYYRDLGEVTPAVGQAYEDLVAALDADPANMAAGSSKLKWYEDAFKILYRHYENIGAKDKQDAVNARFDELQLLKQQ